ncbi:MAG: hypothetical protein FVQ84_14410 [Planctomycetes bacterium]|nr:hypothetical protein [Planctomycetota bacterium]
MKRHIILTLILISLFAINSSSYVQTPVGDLASFVTNCSPAPYSEQVPLNNLISFDITDDGKSLNADSIEVKVTDKDGKSLNGNWQKVLKSGNNKKRDYTIVYQSYEMFGSEQKVTVTITAFDYAGNELKSYEYHIITEMRSFGQNRKVNSDLGNLDSSRPVTVCDTIGNTWVAWQAGAGSNRDIYVSKLPKGAGSFDSAVKVTNNANDQCNPAIALDSNDKLHVVWQDNRQADDNNQGDWDIYLSTSIDGTTWSTEIRVNDPNENDQVNPAIALDSNDNQYVVWQDDRAFNQDIYIAKSSDGFTTKTVSEPITFDTTDQTEPVITVDSVNTVYVVWTDSRNLATNGTDIYGAASNNTWTNIAVVSDPKNQTSPVIAAEEAGTILHLLWVDDTDPSGSIFYAYTTDGLQGPTINSDVVDERDDAQKEPAIFVTGSTGTDLRVYASWQDWRNVDTTNPNDTDIYFAELSSSLGTNIFVGDDGTNSYQGEPAIGVCILGFPYLVWTDGRNANTDIYYAASTFAEPIPIWTKDIQHLTGANWGDDYLGKLNSPGEINIKIPPAAFPFDCDMRISASRIMNTNTQRLTAKESKGQFEFGPSGIQFKVPITIAIAYAPSSAKPEVYWYDPENDLLRQEGITNVTYIEKATVHIVRFKVRHFTSFYLFGGDVAAAVGGGGGGGGGGGCAISASSRGNVIEYMLPYFFYIAVLLMIKLKDARNRKII